MIDSKLKTFVVLADCKSYTETAQILFMTQPAVSQHIRKLEEYYKVKLIQIDGRSISLTTSGKALYDYAKVTISGEKSLFNKLNRIAKPLRVGATLSIADYYLPDLLFDTIKQNKLNMTVEVANTEILLNKMKSGDTDCAFIEGIFDDTFFFSSAFHDAEFRAVASASHPLANKSKVSMHSLSQYPLCLREFGSGTRAILENYLNILNVHDESFDRVLEFGSFVLIKKYLACSDAVSFMYSKVAEEEVERGVLKYLDIDGFSLKRQLYFVYPKNSAFIEQCEAIFKEL